MDRLRFSKELTEKVVHLVRFHLFYYNVGEVSPAGVRRFIARVGPDSIPDLIKVREADRIGSGVPKAVPYKLRHLLFMIEKVKRDPVSPKMLKINGDEIMKITSLGPGPRVGQILSALMEEVLEKPEKNEKEYLEKRVAELAKLSDEEIQKLSEAGKEKAEEFEQGIEEGMKAEYHVE
jgi:poly(A) polymerase/tRNA nucleotidyltransferase (CCA-adding enzyme)